MASKGSMFGVVSGECNRAVQVGDPYDIHNENYFPGDFRQCKNRARKQHREIALVGTNDPNRFEKWVTTMWVCDECARREQL